MDLAKEVEILVVAPSAIKPLTKNALSKLSKLKFICLLTIGYDWLDIDYIKSINLPICTIKGATAESVAEHTFGMILDLAKRINEFDRETRLNSAFNFNMYKGKEIFSKTLGIIGLGDIGKQVARIAQAFNMKIIGVNKSGRPVDGVELVDLPTLYRESDVISVNASLNQQTENLIDDNAFEQMKDGVILVNCAREEIVNKEAVIKSLQLKKVFGYGVETAIMKPIPKDDSYYQFGNVIVVPHNGFNTIEADIKSH